MVPSSSSEQTVFADALAQAATERSAYLDRVCGGDAALRARVEALLAAHAEAERQLPSPLVTREFLAPEEKPGDRIGRYKLLEKIGEGGCGLVWMAEQEEPVRRRVALKVIKLGMDTREVIARFEAERQALALMDHPNIAQVYDAGATATGRPFFVMELVRGVPLTKYCDEAGATTPQRLELFIQVCHAIQHAHQKGVIHRDLKPSNILITVNDGVPVPKVIDFGIAKATQGRLTDQTLFTAFEQFIGTPAYMSPEQAVMTSLDVDTRADIYSLGVLLYELLTGRTPFDAQELVQAGLDEIRRRIREVEPPKPSTRLSTMQGEALATVAKLRHTEAPKLVSLVRGDLDWIVMRCLEKDRARRYPTANSLADDLARHLRDEPVSARPPSAAYRFHKLVQRHRLAFAAAGAIAAALVLGTAVATWQAIRARRAENEQRRLSYTAQRAQANERAQRLLAETGELAARRHAYAADISLAQRELANDNLGHAKTLLDRHRPKPGESDLRGWEWRYLWQQCRDEAKTVLSGRLSSLAVSSDGAWLAGAREDVREVTVWNLSTRQATSLRFGETGWPILVAFSPTEPLLVIAWQSPGVVRKDTLIFWHVAQGRLIREWKLEGECSALSFSADGKSLLTARTGQSPGNQLLFWQVADGKPLRSQSVPGWVGLRSQYSLAIAASEVHMLGGWYLANLHHEVPTIGTVVAFDRGWQLAAQHGAEMDGLGMLRITDLLTGRTRWERAAGPEHGTAVTFSPDGKTLATATGFAESAIRLWNVATGEEAGRLEGHRTYVRALAFSPDGQVLASGGSDQTIRLWDVPTRRLLRTLRGHERAVTCLIWLPDGRTVASSSADGSVRLWDTEASATFAAYRELDGKFCRWRFTADGQSVITVNLAGNVERWRGQAWEARDELMNIGERPNPLKWYAGNFARAYQIAGDRPLVAVARSEPKRTVVKVWNWERKALEYELSTQAAEAVPVAFLDHARKLLVYHHALAPASPARGLHEWDLGGSKSVRSWPAAEKDIVMDFDVTPDEQRCLLRGIRNWSLLDFASGTRRDIGRQMLHIEPGSFSPDGRQFAAANVNTVAIYDTASASLEQVETLSGFMFSAHATAFSPDGRRLAATTNGPEAVLVWDTASWERLLALPAKGSDFYFTGFSPDGNVFGAMTIFGGLHLWRAPSWAEIAAAEAVEAADKPRGLP